MSPRLNAQGYRSSRAWRVHSVVDRVYAERHLGTSAIAACGGSTMAYHNLICLLLVAMGPDAEYSTQPGRFVVEHPTLQNLGFEWGIRGDANRNATVTVQ